MPDRDLRGPPEGRGRLRQDVSVTGAIIQCSTCAFFAEPETCHRHPPDVRGQQGQTAFDNYCGEWVSAETHPFWANRWRAR